MTTEDIKTHPCARSMILREFKLIDPDKLLDISYMPEVVKHRLPNQPQPEINYNGTE